MAIAQNEMDQRRNNNLTTGPCLVFAASCGAQNQQLVLSHAIYIYTVYIYIYHMYTLNYKYFFKKMFVFFLAATHDPT